MDASTSRSPRILQIFREPLRPGARPAYDVIEQETARIAANLGCPHPYLAAESLTGPHEVWWLNEYDSKEEQRQVYSAYAENTQLMEALRANSLKKAELTLAPIDTLTKYRDDLSAGPTWNIGHGRFLVITMTATNGRTGGIVFEADDGTLFIVAAFQRREEAYTAKQLAGSGANVLASRPLWSFAAAAWSEADPLFWQAQAG